jgi:hypothetical protein
MMYEARAGGVEMIFFRDKKGRVYLQVWDAKVKRGKVLPRADSKHLDQLRDEEVQAFIDELHPPKDKPKLCETRKLGERWLKHLEERKYDPQTVQQRRSGLESIFSFFIDEENLSIKTWPDHTAKFFRWMEKKKYKPGRVRIVNTSLRMFYKWLAEENEVRPTQLALRKSVADRSKTPLARPLGPDEVLEWAYRCKIPEIKFIGLVGYFFSLRPQESFALVRQDFRNSSEITKLECVKTMSAATLDASLVVYIGKQKQKLNKVVPYAKKGSNGWVCCFNRAAAGMILEMILKLQPQELICKTTNENIYSLWRKHGMPGLSIKDLRRASAYYLGHYSKFTPLQLMKHMRHKKIETTMIYCRRPDEDFETAELIDNVNELKKRHLELVT